MQQLFPKESPTLMSIIGNLEIIDWYIDYNSNAITITFRHGQITIYINTKEILEEISKGTLTL